MTKRFIVRLRQDSFSGPVVASSQVITVNGLNEDPIAASDFVDRNLSGTVTTQQRRANFIRTIVTGQWGIGSTNYTIPAGKEVVVNWNTTISGVRANASWYAVNPYTYAQFTGTGLVNKGALSNLVTTGYGGTFTLTTVPIDRPQTFQLTLWTEELGYSKLLAKSDIYTILPVELTLNGPSTAISGQPIMISISGYPDEYVEWTGITTGSTQLDSTGTATVDVTVGANVIPGTHTWSFDGDKTANSPKHTVTVIELCVPIYVPTVIKETEVVTIEVPTIIQTGSGSGTTTSTTTEAPATIPDTSGQSGTANQTAFYSLTANVSTVNEPGTIEWTISATPLTNVTYPRRFRAKLREVPGSGITANDVIVANNDSDWTEETILLSGLGEQKLPYKWHTNIREDFTTENDENLVVDLYTWYINDNPSTTPAASASVKILDTSKDVQATYSIAASLERVPEGEYIDVTVNTTDTIPDAGRYFKITASGQNVTGSDFTSNSLTFGPWNARGVPDKIRIGIAKDNTLEPNETVKLQLSSWTGATENSTVRAETTFVITAPVTVPTVNVAEQAFKNDLIPFDISGGLANDEVTVYLGQTDTPLTTNLVNPSNPFNLNANGVYSSTANGRLPAQNVGSYDFYFKFKNQDVTVKKTVVVRERSGLAVAIQQDKNNTFVGSPITVKVTGEPGDKIKLYAGYSPSIMTYVKDATLNYSGQEFSIEKPTASQQGLYYVKVVRGGENANDSILIRQSVVGTGSSSSSSTSSGTGGSSSVAPSGSAVETCTIETTLTGGGTIINKGNCAQDNNVVVVRVQFSRPLSLTAKSNTITMARCYYPYTKVTYRRDTMGSGASLPYFLINGTSKSSPFMVLGWEAVNDTSTWNFTLGASGAIAEGDYEIQTSGGMAVYAGKCHNNKAPQKSNSIIISVRKK